MKFFEVELVPRIGSDVVAELKLKKGQTVCVHINTTRAWVSFHVGMASWDIAAIPREREVAEDLKSLERSVQGELERTLLTAQALGMHFKTDPA